MGDREKPEARAADTAHTPAPDPAGRPRALWQDQFDHAPTPTEIAAKTLELYRERVDPWNLEVEQDRFARTNEIFARRFGRVGRLLEVGCGEGYQTAWLARLADRIVGIDISPEALARARMLVPAARFHVAGLPDIALPPDEPAFDAVAACEVIYFAPEKAAAVAHLATLAPRGLITVLARKWPRIERAAMALPDAETARIEGKADTWIAVTWCAPGARG